jgi:CheY-like chemotaxis protein
MTAYRILVIEDQPEVRHMLASGLRLLGPNFDILEVPSAEEGFLLALRGAVDLLVVDVRLPGISGLELVEKVHGRNPQLKIILITGVEDNTIRQQVTEAQVDAYFYKPIVMDEFIQTVLDCLDVKQEDHMHALAPEGEAPGLGEAVPGILDLPESLMQRLYTLRVELKAYAAIILDRKGRLLAQSGVYPPLFSEPAVIPSMIDAWRAAEQFSAMLAIEQPASLLCIGGQHYHLLLTHAGRLYILLVVVSGPGFRGGWEQALRRAQDDLECTLSSIAMPAAAQDSEDIGALIEMKDQSVQSELADVEFLMQMLGQVEVGDDVDSFWDQAVEVDMFGGMDSGGVLSYDQARKLGLLPQEGEHSKSQDGLPPNVSEG